MKTIHLALIGKNIQHSKSKLIYEELLQKEILYDFLDVNDPQLLPTLNDLSNLYDGVSITSPYKVNYLSEPSLTIDSISQDLRAINCLGFFDGKNMATNTDYLGMKEIFLNELKQETQREMVIFGDGAMARIVKHVAREFKIKFDHFSRKTHGDLTDFKLSSSFSHNSKLLIINCCDRNFVYKGDFPSDSWFWDLNYNYIPHQDTLPNKCERYIDGSSLLKAQARQALQFWGIK